MSEKQAKGQGTLGITAREQRVNQQLEKEDGIDLMEMFYSVLTKWVMILIVTVVGALVAGAYTQFMLKPTYRSQSVIYVLANKDTVLNYADLQIGSALAQDYVMVFDMHEVHEDVSAYLEQLPEDDRPSRTYTANRLKSMVSVNNKSGTRMLEISVVCGNKKDARIIADAYALIGSARIHEKMATDTPSIMSQAQDGVLVGPHKLRNIILGMLAGFVLSAGIAVVMFLMDDKVRTAEDIQRHFGLINLAVIPVEEASAAENRKRHARAAKAGSHKKEGRK